MAIVLTRVEPIDQRESRAIVCERGCLGARGEIRTVRMPVFPPDDEARGTRLHDLRVACGLGLREAARAVGLSPSVLSAVERGELRPEGDAESGIARMYRVAAGKRA